MDRAPSPVRIAWIAWAGLCACGDDVATEGGASSSGASDPGPGSSDPETTSGAETTAAMPGPEDATDTGAGLEVTSSGGAGPPATSSGTTDAEATGGEETGTTSSGAAPSSTSSGGVEAVCGDGVIEGAEGCDGEALGGASCPVFGDIACAADCTLDLSGCDDGLVVCSPPTAPLGALQTPLDPLIDAVQVDEDFFVVDLEVTVDITHPWVGDLTAVLDAPVAGASSVLFAGPCGPAENIDARFDDEGALPVCGNFPALGGDVLPVTELRDLVGLSSQGAWSLRAWDEAPFADDGTLQGWCLELTLSDQDPVVCGDGVANYGEVCDGADVEEDCSALGMGFVAGAVTCADDCTLDTTGCVVAGCGNGVLDPFEACDGADLDGVTCSDFDGLDGSGLQCGPDCTFDTSGCGNVVCGDGVVAGPEVCDAAALGGATCEDVPGYTGGTLGCLPDCSGYDLSGCDANFVEVCSTPSAPISNQLVPTVDAVDFAEPGTVADVNVFVDITHTWVGDLQIDLESPAGTTAVLFDACGDVDDMQAVFDDEGVPLSCGGMPGVAGAVQPSEALMVFDGEVIAGAWTLSVTDAATGDDGVLNAWCLQITPGGG